jgi:hypothetical protein
MFWVKYCSGCLSVFASRVCENYVTVQHYVYFSQRIPDMQWIQKTESLGTTLLSELQAASDRMYLVWRAQPLHENSEGSSDPNIHYLCPSPGIKGKYRIVYFLWLHKLCDQTCVPNEAQPPGN